MFDVAILGLLVSLYFFTEGSETSYREAGIAIAVYGLYLVVYLLVEPFPAATSNHMGQLYGYVPMLSFAAILFPHFNPSSPEIVTKVIGWLGLTGVLLILCSFKLFVW